MKNDHSFTPGKRFATRENVTKEACLDAVIKSHGYLERFRVSTHAGDYWREPSEKKIDLGFENGSAGIVFFYLELYRITGEAAYFDIARRGMEYLRLHWRSQLIDSTDNENVKTIHRYELNICSGVGSIGVLFLVFHKALKDDASKSALREIASEYVAKAEQNGDEVTWTGVPSFSTGDSGIAVLLLKISEVLGDDALRALSVRAARTILKHAKDDPRGGKLFSVIPKNFNEHYPNFVVGTAGIAYAFSIFYEAVGDKEFLDAAEAGAAYLKAIAVNRGEGALIPAKDDGLEDLFFVGWCHGPAGSSRVFYRLYRLTGNEAHKEFTETLVRGILAIGAPEIQSGGYWNTTNICCGTAALLQFFIGLYLAFEDPHYLELAERSAKVILGEAEEIDEDAIGWPLAVLLSDTEKITIDKGYLHGSAGIACALLQIYQVLNGDFRWDRLPDDPFPSKKSCF
jgi:lantibiotic modifying enzyme